MYCPDRAINEEVEVDLDYCKGCGICANECPKKAIADGKRREITQIADLSGLSGIGIPHSWCRSTVHGLNPLSPISIYSIP